MLFRFLASTGIVFLSSYCSAQGFVITKPPATTVVVPPVAATSPLAEPKKCLCYFTASWCVPCKQMKPIVAKLAESGTQVCEIDIDSMPEESKLGVKLVPTFVFLVDGKEVNRITGATTYEKLVSGFSTKTAQPVSKQQQFTNRRFGRRW